MRGKEDTQSVYLSQPIWRLVLEGAGIFPSRGDSADPEILPGHLLPGISLSLWLKISGPCSPSWDPVLLQKHLLALHTNSHLEQVPRVRELLED